jgi:PTH1 family peptidyl-tRNA hydrolase
VTSQDFQQPNNAWLIVGLGNPGRRFAGTRHNAGFLAVDELARRHGLRFSNKQANAEIARGAINGVGVILAKPLTYMNNSGLAIGSLARFYKIPHNRVLVAYDDIALPLGKIRIRGKGSAGGHNGLTSVIQHLGTQNFPRLRIGVDRPIGADYKRIDWVLGHFSKEEGKAMDEVIPHAAEAIEAVLRDGIDRAMNTYNTDVEAFEREGEDVGAQWSEAKSRAPLRAETKADKSGMDSALYSGLNWLKRKNTPLPAGDTQSSEEEKAE